MKNYFFFKLSLLTTSQQNYFLGMEMNNDENTNWTNEVFRQFSKCVKLRYDTILIDDNDTINENHGNFFFKNLLLFKIKFPQLKNFPWGNVPRPPKSIPANYNNICSHRCIFSHMYLCCLPPPPPPSSSRESNPTLSDFVPRKPK